MPLFNFDDAITAVITAHAKYAQIPHDIEAKNKSLRGFIEDRDLLLDRSARLGACHSITAFNQAITSQKSTQEKLNELEEKKQNIQAKINALPKITSSLTEREQLEKNQIILEKLNSLSLGLKSLQFYLNDIQLQRTVPNYVGSDSAPQNAYNVMINIVKIEKLLSADYSVNITNELIQILMNSPVAKLLASKNTYQSSLITCIDPAVAEEQKENIRTEHALVDAEKTRLADSISELNQIIYNNESDAERALPEAKEALEQQKIQTSREYSWALNKQSSDEAIITAFNALPIEEPLTEDKIRDYDAELRRAIATVNDQIIAHENELDHLMFQQAFVQKDLTDAVKALQDQYNQSALTLVALSTCAAVALVLLEVLTLPMAAPVLLVSLAAIGLWHHNQTTDPETLSNTSPAP
tara:strand:+ start:279 stop:1514 length:1236 start_codon:yes stop_codon:yes gene_type:complete